MTSMPEKDAKNLKKYATIYDIAERTKLSPSTVNRALRGSKCVKDSTRRKVLAMAEELNYKANPMAKGLKRSIKRIGVVVNECGTDFQRSVLQGAEDIYNTIKESQDINLEAEFTVIPRGTTLNSTINKINKLIDEGVDGIIFSPDSSTGYEEVIKRANLLNIPIATVTSDVDCEGVLYCVRSNAELEGKIAADLLKLYGLKKDDKILVYTGRDTNMGNKENMDAFTKAISETDYQIEEIINHQDDNGWARRTTDAFFEKGKIVRCIYSSTPVTMPILEMLEEKNYLDKVQILASDVTERILPYILDGTIKVAIYKNAHKQGKTAFLQMYEYLLNNTIPPRTNYIDPEIVVKANAEYVLKKIKNKSEDKVKER